MVLPNQFLERMIVLPGPDGLALEGLYHRGEPDRVPILVSAPHPAYGGTMESPVCAEIAYAGFRRGHPTLRYNYRGAGASQGALGPLDGLGDESLADLESAMEYFKGESPETGDKLILAGYSFGAWISLQRALADEAYRIWKLILIAPPVALMDFDRLPEATHPTLIVVGDVDRYSDIGKLRLWAEQSEGRIKLFVLEDIDHFFQRGLAEIGQRTMEFLG